MLTLELLKEMAPHKVFATGLATDKEGSLFMTGSGEQLMWVAERGSYHDWAIYCHYSFHGEEWIRRHGDKVCRESHIKLLVPCDDEAFKMYRY